MEPAAVQWEWSCNTQRQWDQAHNSFRHLLCTGVQWPRSCCLRNIWYQVREVEQVVGLVGLPTGGVTLEIKSVGCRGLYKAGNTDYWQWSNHLFIVVSPVTSVCPFFMCVYQCVQTTTTYGRGRWPGSEGWSPPSRAPPLWRPSKYCPWRRRRVTGATALGMILVRKRWEGKRMWKERFMS